MALMPESLLEFARSLKGGADASSNVKQATVTRVDADGTVYVNIPGGEIETPVSNKSADVAVGDKVMVAARNGQLTIQGNYSKPSTDDTVANQARQMSSVALSNADAAAVAAGIAQASADTAAAAAASAESSASDALTAAGNAQTSANNALASATQANEYASRALGNLSTVQSVAETLTWIAEHGTMALTTDTALDPTHVYFVQDTDGDYVVNNVHYSIVSEPVTSALSTYYELSIDESLNNYVGTHLALTSEGLWLLPDSSGGYKILIATGAGSTYTTAGTYIIDSSAAVLAYFGSGGARIGNTTSGNYALIDSDSFDIFHTSTEMVHFGYGEGNSSNGTARAPYYTIGTRETTTDAYDSTATYAVGDHVVYNDVEYVCITAIETAEAWTSSHWQRTVGNYSVSMGYNTTASGYNSTAMCGSTTAGSWSLAAGNGSTAGGTFSTAIGYSTAASRIGSTAIGYNSEASGDYATALGNSAAASGRNSTAIGVNSEASGDDATALGCGTTAGGDYSTAMGEYTVAGGDYSTAMGQHTTAGGYCATALGRYTTAGGRYSTAVGDYTIASSDDQTALGKYNVEDTSGTYAVIVGNGRSSARSNALAVDWSGNIDIGGVRAYMTFVTTAIANFSPPWGVTSCLVLDTSDYGLYWYTA